VKATATWQTLICKARHGAAHLQPKLDDWRERGVRQMNLSSLLGPGGDGSLEVLSEDSERVLCRGWRDDGDGDRKAVLAVLSGSAPPTPGFVDRLAHEYALKDELDGRSAVRPLALVREHGRIILLFKDPGGEPLDRLLGRPMEMSRFLNFAIGLSIALRQLHERGLIHKDIKPANVLVNSATGQVWLMGFGIATRLPRERQAPEPPEFIAGTLPYMAPEQTGRMNRSIDSRSDLYALGVTLYEMLTGCLPFTASDPMEWVYCHIAKQPVPPVDRVTDVPAAVSAIILKLLTKTAEERYQTAAGVEADLRRCLTEWESRRRIDAFSLGLRDTSDRLLIPEKLYGRAREIGILRASFDRVVANGTAELVLVSGYSGIGKSSVVNELYKVLVPSRGLFASGKFDQYKRDIPYATLAQALRTLVRQILVKSEVEVDQWRRALTEAIEPNGLLIVDLVPELKLIIGEQPQVPELPPQDAQSRFQLVFRRFIAAFARPEHPLTLFLDDLQWLDAATLDLLEDLLTRPDVQHLMLIGAYRDNEVSSAHPLMRKLEAIGKTGTIVQEIILAPLTREDLEQLIGDALHSEPERATSLAQLVHEKTAGNPFFAIQFISALAEERLLAFDHGDARWSWDLKRIHAKGYTDNVVDLLVGKLNRLPAETQKALRQLACIGNSAEFALLKMVYHDSKREMHDDLWEAVRMGFIFRSEGTYRFLHDRVQEAAYSLITEGARSAAHLRIGRLLASRSAPAEVEERIFEIVNQFNRGSDLITSGEERERVAELNFIAGRRAKISTAYASALAYLAAGRALLTEESWDHNYELIFAIEFHMAECELLTADMAAAEDRLSMLAQQARGAHHIAAVARLRLTLYTTLDRSDRSVEVCLDYLNRGSTDWSPHPTRDEVRREYERIWSQLGSRSIEELIDLPLMSNPEPLAALDVLTEVVTPALFTDENLLSLVICRMVNLSLEHGNSDGSCFAYVWLGMIAGPHFGNYEAGFRFGRLGYDLVEQRGLHRFQARTYMSFGNLVMPWTRHILTGRDLVRRAFDAANKIGDVTFAAYSCNNLNTNLLAAGDPLGDVQREAEKGLDFAQNARFGLVIDIITAQLRLIRTLRGLTPKFGSFDDVQFDELRFERHLASDPRLALPACWYWIRKLQARFFAEDYSSALQASVSAERLLWTSPSFFEVAEYHFYSALSRAACCYPAMDDRRKHFEALVAHQKQLEGWAENCPENFKNRTALVAAEIARIEGRDLDAMRLYEQAIHSARENSFVQNEAVANELAGRFYLDRGLEKNGYVHLHDARACYALWGADGKMRQLDRLYPSLAAPERHRSTATIGSSIQQLDVASVVKASQAISSEIELPKLIERLMTIALENAGANRGLLIRSIEEDHLIQAEAQATGDQIEVVLCRKPITGITCPEALLRYVIRTHESVILDDASRSNLFSEDDYLRGQQTKSILCLPLIKQGQLTGLLYLENTLTSYAFTPDRIAVLELLAAQAAISLENTRLYGDLREREAKVRRLVDSNIIGVFIWDLDGRVIEANEAFLHMVGHSRDDLSSGRMRWSKLTPAEWSAADEQAVAELKATGVCKSYEKECFRKDGSRVPVLAGAATFGESQDQGVAFMLDLTERKRAEEDLRESEQRYRETQIELAHVNRVTTMGQLTASIAHEVSQPIAAAVTNASAGLRWLAAQPPDLKEVRDAFDSIIKAGNQAGEVIGRIRGLIKKVPARKTTLDINETILETIALTRSEMGRHCIVLQTELANDLPSILGDRVQLQQLMLNLIMNAIEAMSEVSEGSRVLLIGSRADTPDGVIVTVQDSGPGLKPESLDHLFDPFYTTKPTGMGMGLSICRSIIEAHGGRLWGTKNAPRGTVFQFTLHQDDAF
jgi:PAS domain S-box-containing protein